MDVVGPIYQQKLCFMHKGNYGMVLSYIVDSFSPLVSEILGYPLRNNNIFSTRMSHQNPV